MNTKPIKLGQIRFTLTSVAFSLMSLCSYSRGFAPSLWHGPALRQAGPRGDGGCGGSFCSSKPQPSSAWGSQGPKPPHPPHLSPLLGVTQTVTAGPCHRERCGVSAPGAPALPKGGFSSAHALNQLGNQNLLENRTCSRRAEFEMMPLCKFFKNRLRLGKAHGQNNKETVQKATAIREK